MTDTATHLHISEGIVAEVRDYAYATPPEQFYEEEAVRMQAGMAAFESGMCRTTGQFGGELAAQRMRAGLLVGHRVLRLANEAQALPPDIDEQMGLLAGNVDISYLFTPGQLEHRQSVVRQAYADHPGVPMLLDGVLQRLPSRIGGTLLLGLHMKWVNPNFAVRFNLAPGPVPQHARAGRSTVSRRTQRGRG